MHRSHLYYGHDNLRPAHTSLHYKCFFIYPLLTYTYIYIYITAFSEVHSSSFFTIVNVCRWNSCSAKVPNVRSQGSVSSKHWLTGVGWQMSVRWIESHNQIPGWILGKCTSFSNSYTTECLWRTSRQKAQQLWNCQNTECATSISAYKGGCVKRCP